jgi:hypothetical protein
MDDRVKYGQRYLSLSAIYYFSISSCLHVFYLKPWNPYRFTTTGLWDGVDDPEQNLRLF